MAYTPQSNQYDWTPNSDVPFEIATSFNDNQLDLSADEGGYGSFLNRSVATDLLYYYATEFPFDQMSQIFGGMEDTPTGVKEFFEADSLFEYEAQGVNEDASDVVNNVSGANSYVPASSARFVLSANDVTIFSAYSEIRYETSNGWQYAYVTSIDDGASDKELNIDSIDGSNLTEAATDNAIIQHIATNMPQDLDYDPQPKQSDPTGYEAYVENYRKETKMTRKERNMNATGGTLIDLVDHYQKQLTENFRRDRETKNLLGSGTKTRKQLSNNDVVNFSNGIYYQIRDNNLHTSDFKSGGVFDADKFKRAIYNFMLYNYGGESGGPRVRDLYVDPVMQSYFDQAWEDSERFVGGTVNTEFVAGVTVNRVANSQGVMDIMQVPNWSSIHPLKDGQIRGGSDPKGVGMLLPMDQDHVVRVLQTGFGPTQEVFKLKGGDRVMYQRMESKEGTYLGLIQHDAVIEEVAEA